MDFGNIRLDLINIYIICYILKFTSRLFTRVFGSVAKRSSPVRVEGSKISPQISRDLSHGYGVVRLISVASRAGPE